MLRALYDAMLGKPAASRSSQWPAVERSHLTKQPECQVCGGKSQLNVHHLKPFHLFPELELVETNLVTLCNASRCHITFGHGGDFKAWNPHATDDIALARQMIQSRKYTR